MIHDLTITEPAQTNGYVEGNISVDLTVKKLSKLQRFILKAAFGSASNMEFYKVYGSEMHLYNYEILQVYFGFVQERPWLPKTKLKDGKIHREAGGKDFDPDEIGRARYQSASASVSRACKRLEQRYLITRYYGVNCHWAGLKLTESGVAVSRRLAMPWLLP